MVRFHALYINLKINPSIDLLKVSASKLFQNKYKEFHLRCIRLKIVPDNKAVTIKQQGNLDISKTWNIYPYLA